MKSSVFLLFSVGISCLMVPVLLQATLFDEEIDALTDQQVVINGPGQLTCVICCEILVEDDPASMRISCNHQFHASCINEWLRNNNTCPMCRAILIERRPIPSQRIRALIAEDGGFVSLGVAMNRHNQWLNNRLLAATQANNTQCVENLLNQGARPNSPAHDGKTSLHLAVQNNNAGLVALLLRQGANSLIRDADGNTPLSLAINLGHDVIIGLLESIEE